MKSLTYLSRSMLLGLVLCGPSFGQAHPPIACHSGELWSSRFPGAVDGDFILIPSGLTVALDVTTPNLGGLWVEGVLVFDHSEPTGTVELRTAYAVVTGTLQIGCRNGSLITRFWKKTHLTLVAPESYSSWPNTPNLTSGVNWPALMMNTFGTNSKIYEAALDRGLIIAGTGRLFIYGNDTREQGWTTLANTVDAPEDFLPFSDPIASSWKVGDEIVIASTDFEYADQWVNGLENGGLITADMRGGHDPGYLQGEERIIESIDPVNQGVVVTVDLLHQHWSSAISATFAGGSETIEERAEIGNLTRSVVIRGEESAYSSSVRGGTSHRGHVILLPLVSGIPYCEVDWAEFRNLGVEGKLGRYPFHWHMLGDARQGGNRPYLRDCSIHHSVNRFVTVHNTKYVDVERNVGYDALGAGYFLEDADEEGNPLGEETQFVVLRDNLGMKVGRPLAHVEDYPEIYQELELIDPSVFWIQHPNQIVEGNHAAGAAGHGFYLAPGATAAAGWSHLASGESKFRNNVSHSNGQHGFYHQSLVSWGWQTGDAPAGEGLVAWKNRRYGIWWRTKGVSLLSGCRLADNKSGYYPASSGRQEAHDGNLPPTCRLMFEDGVIFGETPNLGKIDNLAESDAHRSLPQTYWNFMRQDTGAVAHESNWDTLNAVESYDGRNVVTGLKVAYFEDDRTLSNPNPNGSGSAVQRIAAITQVEYNSKYCEDPRNDVTSVQFATGSGQTVVNPIGFRMTNASLGFSMIRNTVVHDKDGSLGYGADVYVCYDDSFFDANATASGTVDTARNLRILPSSTADFAQFEISTDLPASSQKMTVTTSHLAGGTRSLVLAGMPSGTADYGFNAPIGLDNYPAIADGGVYRCSFGSLVPEAYEIKIQFAENEDVPTIIGVPLSGLPSTLTLNVTTNLINNAKGSLTALLTTGDRDAFFYDTTNSILFVRTTTVVLGAAGADEDGTRNVIRVNQ